MITFFLLSLPIFGVVAAGWMATRAGWMPAGTIDVLGTFSFRFALPALVLRLIAGQPLDASFNSHFYTAFLACGAAIFLLVLVLSWIVGCDVAAASAHATTASVSNLGFLGPPLMLAFFGERGAGPLAMAIMAEVMVLLSLGSVLMSLGANRSATTIATILLRGTLLNPIVAAILFGVALAASNVALPQPLHQFLGFLGAAAGPTALFALGAALALQKIDRATITAALSISVAKLAVYPLLAWLVLARFLELAPFWWQTGVVIAALPSAGNIYVLAQRYGADPERVSGAIVASTVMSVVTVPFVAWLVLG